MVLDSLLAGVMLFSSFAARTPNVQPNPDDYEISIGVSHNNFHLNRQWERELGEFYIDDLFWYKFDNVLYFKPEYMNKESKEVKYLKIDSRKTWGDWTFGFTSRSDDDVFNGNFETFASVKLAVESTGAVRELVSLEAMDLTGAAKKAGELTGNYKAPGQ